MAVKIEITVQQTIVVSGKWIFHEAPKPATVKGKVNQ